MERKKRRCMEVLHGIRRWVGVLLIAGLMVLGMGCYGSFPITHFVYELNGTIAPGLLRQIAFWVFTIFPVYGTAALGDVVIMNLIEFWTGADFGGFSQAAGAGDLEFAMEPGTDGQTAVATITRQGEPVARAVFVRVSDEVCEVRDLEGRLLARAVRADDGSVRLEASDGSQVSMLSPEDVEALLASSR